MVIKAFIFDLDYVLFNEDLYYFAVFEKMSLFLNLDNEKLNLMKKFYIKNKLLSKDILGDILKNLKLYTPHLQEKFFEFYKTVYKPLPLYRDVKEVLFALRKKDYKLGIITNGTVEAQKNKIKCLGIGKF
ncbi:MAG TPA: HAD family hydrolase, partial [Candidatus Atribacteria bacterium]|nr:HAD family hydrolase [Candidatus Atribacteria bacterium]